MNRPTLIPGLPRAWRGRTELQLGSGPTRAVLLRLPEPRAAHVLDLLDGSRSERLVLLHAAEQGIPAHETRAVIATLHAAGLAMPAAALFPPALPHSARARLISEATALALHGTRRSGTGPRHGHPTPASVLRRRASSRVVLAGHGRLGAAIAVTLAEAGVGHIQPEVSGTVTLGELAAGPLREADVGRPRREALAAAVTRASPGAGTQGVRRGAAALVIQLDHDEPVDLVAAAHASRRQPHLAVTIREGAAVVGPLVPAAGGPCLSCLDMHRKDRDALWPGPRRAQVPEPCAATTLLAAAAYAAAEALTFLDGGTPETLGASAEITTPGRVRRRTWPPHPHCDCSRRRSYAGARSDD